LLCIYMSILHNLQYLEDTHNHSRFFYPALQIITGL
jgi:hypothetical protein